MPAIIAPSSDFAAAIRANLLAWYDAHRRRLPWRANPGENVDPYRVWLSEIMLQQTTVAHAAPYFEIFVRRWPTVGALAGAADAEVMSTWAGLGYYARARNLLACARAVVAAGGGFPAAEADLRVLPGIGAYTAAAIAAIAFDRPANAVDANVERVMARLFAVETPLPAAKPELVALAAGLVGEARSGDWAQALMDLGATVCRPKAPECSVCPLTGHCAAKAHGLAAALPRRTARAERPQRYGVVYRLTYGDKVAVVRRPPRGLLGGMLGLPTTAWRAARWTAAEALSAAPTEACWQAYGEVRHVFTHFSLALQVLGAETNSANPDFLWLPADEAAIAAPSLFRKALRLGP
ncbi:MAG TPA: A/G-specific adenine glycosylase [Caulobacteraceae bacterium]